MSRPTFEPSDGRVASALPVTGTHRTPAGDDWIESETPGFLVRPLVDDPARGHRTLLMKVEAGAFVDLHVHDEFEEIYVIDGTFADQDATYRPGDFVVRAPATPHTASSTTGATVLLVYTRSDTPPPTGPPE